MNCFSLQVLDACSLFILYLWTTGAPALNVAFLRILQNTVIHCNTRAKCNIHSVRICFEYKFYKLHAVGLSLFLTEQLLLKDLRSIKEPQIPAQ